VSAQAMLLEASGHVVYKAFGGEEALAIAQTTPLDVALLDLGMPDLSGWDVARRLRREPRFSHLKLLAVSGYGTDRDRSESLESGFDWHLVKPVDWEELIRILEGLSRVAM
jgi:DNA-binding response OmpR family regulator